MHALEVIVKDTKRLLRRTWGYIVRWFRAFVDSSGCVSFVCGFMVFSGMLMWPYLFTSLVSDWMLNAALGIWWFVGGALWLRRTPTTFQPSIGPAISLSIAGLSASAYPLFEQIPNRIASQYASETLMLTLLVTFFVTARPRTVMTVTIPSQ